MCGTSLLLTRPKQKNDLLVQVEVDEAFSFMCHITIEASPQDAGPKRVVLLVQLFLIRE